MQRNRIDSNIELREKPATVLKKLRDLFEKEPNIKRALQEYLEPTLSLLKHRFSRLKLHDKNIVHAAASKEEIKDVSNLLDLFKDDNLDAENIHVGSIKEKEAPVMLNYIMERHCIARLYSL